jgi:hypothetical protein
MGTNRSVRSAAPDGLEARLGLRAEGARERQAALPRPLQEYHRALLDAFLAGTGPPALTVVGRLAAELELEPQAALAALAVADLVHTDPGAGTATSGGGCGSVAGWVFGGLLHPARGHDSPGPPPGGRPGGAG